jgi:hypothetical protein
MAAIRFVDRLSSEALVFDSLRRSARLLICFILEVLLLQSRPFAVVFGSPLALLPNE